VGIVPFSPLGRGFFTGALAGQTFTAGDSRSRMPRFSDENLAANERVVEVIKDVADAHYALPGQVALAWVQQQGDDVVPIPGTKRVSYLEQNTGALDLELTDDERARLDGLAAQVAGGRY
jgi:aryl-alcohol dehydrogenase-like predicted oxidoreductase